MYNLKLIEWGLINPPQPPLSPGLANESLAKLCRKSCGIEGIKINLNQNKANKKTNLLKKKSSSIHPAIDAVGVIKFYLPGSFEYQFPPVWTKYFICGVAPGIPSEDFCTMLQGRCNKKKLFDSKNVAAPKSNAYGDHIPNSKLRGAKIRSIGTVERVVIAPLRQR